MVLSYGSPSRLTQLRKLTLKPKDEEKGCTTPIHTFLPKLDTSSSSLLNWSSLLNISWIFSFLSLSTPNLASSHIRDAELPGIVFPTTTLDLQTNLNKRLFSFMLFFVVNLQRFWINSEERPKFLTPRFQSGCYLLLMSPSSSCTHSKQTLFWLTLVCERLLTLHLFRHLDPECRWILLYVLTIPAPHHPSSVIPNAATAPSLSPKLHSSSATASQQKLQKRPFTECLLWTSKRP